MKIYVKSSETVEPWYYDVPDSWKGVTDFYNGSLSSLKNGKSYRKYRNASDMISNELSSRRSDAEISKFVSNADESLGKVGLNAYDYPAVYIEGYGPGYYIVVGKGKAVVVEGEYYFKETSSLTVVDPDVDVPVLEKWVLGLL